MTLADLDSSGFLDFQDFTAYDMQDRALLQTSVKQFVALS